MKKVRLTHYREDNDEYQIFLGNGTAHHFSSTRNANQFLCTISRFLTNKLYEANEIYVKVFTKYRVSWGSFEHNQNMAPEMRESDRLCYLLLSQSAESFNMIVERCGLTNGNYFVFIHFNNIIKNLKEVVRNLNNLCSKKSAQYEIYAYDFIFKELQILEGELKNYGQLDAKNMFYMPQHIDMNKEFIPEIDPVLTSQIKLKVA